MPGIAGVAVTGSVAGVVVDGPPVFVPPLSTSGFPVKGLSVPAVSPAVSLGSVW